MIELQQLLVLEQQNPTDDKILSQLAFYYLENPDGNKDLEYFKKAYEVNPSIKNIHNYAFWLYSEYGDYELSIKLFEELLNKNPKSFYPYMVYAHVLFGQCNILAEQNNIDKYLPRLLECCQKSLELFKNTPQEYQKTHYYEYAWIYNHLGIACLINHDYQQADRYFNLAINELSTHYVELDDDSLLLLYSEIDEYRYHITLNKVRLKILMQDLSTANIFLHIASKLESSHFLDIAHLYALMGDYEQCNHIIQENMPQDNIYIDMSWDWIWYAIRQVDNLTWQNRISQEIEHTQDNIIASQQQLLSCTDDKNEILASIDYLQNYLNKLNLWKNNPPLPHFNIEQECRLALHHFSKCWLFDCHNCHNLTDDE